MHFNPKALLVCVAFCLLMMMALSSGSGWTHAAEAAASVFTLLSVFGFKRDGRPHPASRQA
jgi:hypothetical protein